MTKEFLTLREVYEYLGIPDHNVSWELLNIPISELRNMTPEMAEKIRNQMGSGWLNNTDGTLRELDLRYSRHEIRTREDGTEEAVFYIPLPIKDEG